MLGACPGRVHDLATRSTLVETRDHDRQLRTPGLDPPHERTNSGTATAAQSDDNQRRTLIAQPLNEVIAIGVELKAERRVAAADGQRPTEGVLTSSGYDNSGKHRYLHR